MAKFELGSLVSKGTALPTVLSSTSLPHIHSFPILDLWQPFFYRLVFFWPSFGLGNEMPESASINLIPTTLVWYIHLKVHLIQF